MIIMLKTKLGWCKSISHFLDAFSWAFGYFFPFWAAFGVGFLINTVHVVPTDTVLFFILSSIFSPHQVFACSFVHTSSPVVTSISFRYHLTTFHYHFGGLVNIGLFINLRYLALNRAQREKSFVILYFLLFIQRLITSCFRSNVIVKSFE